VAKDHATETSRNVLNRLREGNPSRNWKEEKILILMLDINWLLKSISSTFYE
jgi:hypothetical protein